MEVLDQSCRTSSGMVQHNLERRTIVYVMYGDKNGQIVTYNTPQRKEIWKGSGTPRRLAVAGLLAR